MNYKNCKKCHKNKKHEYFRLTCGRNKNIYIRNVCVQCERENSKLFIKNNKEKHKINCKNFIINNPDYKANWKSKNKEKIKNYTKEYEKRLHVKLRKRISDAIRKSLKSKGIKKNLKISNLLKYNKEDLQTHLESLFEPWMNWDNWGIYNPKTWDDNDQLTWKWQIDHIIPMANFVYKSENDLAFINMWKLENLRPYSAKQNIIDGASRNRILAIHKKT